MAHLTSLVGPLGPVPAHLADAVRRVAELSSESGSSDFVSTSSSSVPEDAEAAVAASRARKPRRSGKGQRYRPVPRAARRYTRRRPYGDSLDLDRLNRLRDRNPGKLSLAEFLEHGAASGVRLSRQFVDEYPLRRTVFKDASRVPEARQRRSVRIWNAFLEWALQSGPSWDALESEEDLELAVTSFVTVLTHLGARGAGEHLAQLRNFRAANGLRPFPRSALIRAALKANEDMEAARKQDGSGEVSRVALLCPIVDAWLASPGVARRTAFLRDRAVVLVGLALARRGGHVKNWRVRHFQSFQPPLAGARRLFSLYTGQGKTKSDSDSMLWIEPADPRGSVRLCPHTALCEYFELVLRAKLAPDDFLFQNTRDGVPVPGGPQLRTEHTGRIVAAVATVAARSIPLDVSKYGAKSIRMGTASMFSLSNLPERKLEVVAGWSLRGFAPKSYFKTSGVAWPSKLSERPTLPGQMGFATDWDRFASLAQAQGTVLETDCRAPIVGPLPSAPLNEHARAEAPESASSDSDVSSSSSSSDAGAGAAPSHSRPLNGRVLALDDAQLSPTSDDDKLRDPADQLGWWRMRHGTRRRKSALR